MSTKNLLVLGVVLVLLAAVAYFTRTPPATTEVNALAIGDPVLPELDVNQAQAISITSPEGTNRLSRKGDIWVVNSLYEYPADFSRIREQLTGLLDLSVGQVMRADDATLADTGLGDAATRVTLLGTDDTEIATIRVGSARTTQTPGGGGFGGGYPDGQYVAIDDENVLVVSRPLSGLSTNPTDWIERQLLQVDANEVATISVENGDDSYVIQNDTNQVMTLEGLAENETFESSSASQLKRALSYLSCQSVADPGLSDEAAGLTEAATYTATLRDGRAYAVALGAETNNARYARFTITGDEERTYLQDWTYLIPSYAATSMTVARETLVKEKEEEEAEEAEADPEPTPVAEPEPLPEPESEPAPAAEPEPPPIPEAVQVEEPEAAPEAEPATQP